MLRSRAHRLLSGSLLVLEYEGRTTLRRFEIPVAYAEHDGGLVVLAAHPESKKWWRAFREPARAAVVLRGERRVVEGQVLDGVERRDALRAYLARRARAARALRVGRVSTDAELDGLPAAIVAFGPLHEELPPGRGVR